MKTNVTELIARYSVACADGTRRYLIDEVNRLCDRVVWCHSSRHGGDLDADLDALEKQRCVVERILAAMRHEL